MAAAPVPVSSTAFLRHALATLAYRAEKALRDAPPHFANFEAAPGTRTPLQILAHMGDLMDWALTLAEGSEAWHDATPLPWPEEVARFFLAMGALDRRLSSDEPLGCSAERFFAGPIADALTHTGQIGMLRRIAGSPVLGENYFVAHITVGRVGTDQAAAVYEFEKA